ncbi:MAG: hypothetical protein JKY25_12650 [Robiginitomaculum sp.]|nr:hypothetical protein [Robiginitomaculum sp.]
MPRKQNHSAATRQQRTLDAIKLNSERMKLVRSIHTSSGNHGISTGALRLMNASSSLMNKVRKNLPKL